MCISLSFLFLQCPFKSSVAVRVVSVGRWFLFVPVLWLSAKTQGSTQYKIWHRSDSHCDAVVSGSHCDALVSGCHCDALVSDSQCDALVSHC